MTEGYQVDEITKLFAELGDKEKAMAIYAARHPEISTEEIQEDFDLEEEERRYGVFDLYCIGSRMTGGYGREDAIRNYMAMHPEVNEADVRAELEKALAEDE